MITIPSSSAIPDDPLKTMKPITDFGIPKAPWSEAEAAIEMLARMHAAQPRRHEKGTREDGASVPFVVVKAIVEIGTQLWKAKAKMVDSTSGEVRDEMKKVFRHIESSFAALEAISVEVKDHTGDSFDYGLPLKVVTSQPTPGISKEQVIETVRPTIYWQKQIIQMGEVVIAVPLEESPKV